MLQALKLFLKETQPPGGKLVLDRHQLTQKNGEYDEGFFATIRAPRKKRWFVKCDSLMS